MTAYTCTNKLEISVIVLHFLDGVLRMSTYLSFFMRNKVKHNFYFQERTNHTILEQMQSFLSNRRASQILCCEFFISVCFEMYQSFLLENKAKQMLLFSKSKFTLFQSKQDPLCREHTKTQSFMRRAVFVLRFRYGSKQINLFFQGFGMFQEARQNTIFSFWNKQITLFWRRKVLCRRNRPKQPLFP